VRVARAGHPALRAGGRSTAGFIAGAMLRLDRSLGFRVESVEVRYRKDVQ